MNLDSQIKSLINKRTKLHLSKLHLERLHPQLVGVYARKRQLEKILKKEYDDVVKLERLSIGRLFKKVLGDLEEQLEMERQEYLQAVLNHKECLKEIKLMQYEKKILTEKVKTLDKVEKEYKRLLDLREDRILNKVGKHQPVLRDYNSQIDDNTSLKREIYEAKIVGTKIKVRLEKMIVHLKAAAELGDWSSDTFVYRGNGKAYVQKAHKIFYEIKPLLFDFETELEDIYKQRNIKIFDGIHQLGIISGMYYDNLISDWVIQKNIRNALSNIESLLDRVLRTLQSLGNEEIRANRNIQYLNARKKALVLDSLK